MDLTGNFGGCANVPDTTAVSFDVDYDGDFEDLATDVDRFSRVGHKERNDYDVSSNNDLKIGAIAEGLNTLVVNELCNNQSNHSGVSPTLIPVSPFTSSVSSVMLSSNPPRTRSFSAAVKVSSLQASFAEKTSLEMQEIVGWYDTTASEERFTIVVQRKSLPNNAMVYDVEDDEDEGDGIEGAGGEAKSNSLDDDEGNFRTPRERNSSHHKIHRATEIRDHLEASDQLIRNTQYMAEVIAKLNISSSTGSDECIDTSCTSSNSPTRLPKNEIAEVSSTDEGGEVLHTVLWTKPSESRKRLHQKPSMLQDYKPNALASLVAPLGLAAFVGVLLRTRLVADGH
jgi:hypothetical protein